MSSTRLALKRISKDAEFSSEVILEISPTTIMGLLGA